MDCMPIASMMEAEVLTMILEGNECLGIMLGMHD